MTPAVFAAGGAMLDCVAAADGRLALEVLGGNAVHAAVGAARMGAHAGVVARVPRGWPAAALAAAGIATDGIQAEPAPMPVPEWFFHRPDGSRVDRLHATRAEAAAFGIAGDHAPADRLRAFEAHLAARAAAGRDPGGWAAFRAAHPVGPAQVPQAWWRAAAAHVAPGATTAQLALARAARARGLRVTLDPGFTARGLDPDLLEALLGACDVFLPSEAELRALRPGLPPDAALASLRRDGGPVLLGKLGGDGALLLDPAEGVPRRIPALPVAAFDPTGAGDAFAGGVLAALAAGEPPARAARHGAVAGSLAVERAGALAPLDVPAAEVARRLALLDQLIAEGAP